MRYKTYRNSYRVLSLSAASLVVLGLCLSSRVDAQTSAPSQVPASSPKLKDIELKDNVVISGSNNKIKGKVTLTAPATEDFQIKIESSDVSVVVVEKEVKVKKGASESEPFVVTPKISAGEKTAKITATFPGETKEITFTVFNLLEIRPETITGGNKLQAVITLPSPAPAGGADVKLYSDTDLITVGPDPIHLQPGERTAHATLETVNRLFGGDGKGKVTASFGLWSQPIETKIEYNGGRLVLAVFVGLAAILITFMGFALLFGQKVSLKSLIMGEDGLPSTSKFQNVLWTFVVIFAYASIAGIKLVYAGITDLVITRNVIIVMGASLGTKLLARTITVNQIEGMRARNSSWVPALSDLKTNGPVKRRESYKYLFADDSGRTDLNKIQMLAWTFIAVGIFLYNWYHQVMGTPSVGMNLPDIDGALVVLMGLSQGAYLGGKLVPSYVPVILNLDPESAKADQEFRINGGPFGEVGGTVIATPVDGGKQEHWGFAKWENTYIEARVPKDHAAGSFEIGVIANGQPSGNTKTFKIT